MSAAGAELNVPFWRETDLSPARFAPKPHSGKRSRPFAD